MDNLQDDLQGDLHEWQADLQHDLQEELLVLPMVTANQHKSMQLKHSLVVESRLETHL